MYVHIRRSPLNPASALKLNYLSNFGEKNWSGIFSCLTKRQARWQDFTSSTSQELLKKKRETSELPSTMFFQGVKMAVNISQIATRNESDCYSEKNTLLQTRGLVDIRCCSVWPTRFQV